MMGLQSAGQGDWSAVRGRGFRLPNQEMVGTSFGMAAVRFLRLQEDRAQGEPAVDTVVFQRGVQQRPPSRDAMLA